MRNVAIFFISIYRNYLSKLKLRQTCRFYPTCSEYSVLALEKHGFVKGLLASLLRILRCHPFSPGGYDPVKENLPSGRNFSRFSEDPAECPKIIAENFRTSYEAG